jgi:hypothetical protein
MHFNCFGKKKGKRKTRRKTGMWLEGFLEDVTSHSVNYLKKDSRKGSVCKLIEKLLFPYYHIRTSSGTHAISHVMEEKRFFQ